MSVCTCTPKQKNSGRVSKRCSAHHGYTPKSSSNTVMRHLFGSATRDLDVLLHEAFDRYMHEYGSSGFSGETFVDYVTRWLQSEKYIARIPMMLTPDPVMLRFPRGGRVLGCYRAAVAANHKRVKALLAQPQGRKRS